MVCRQREGGNRSRLGRYLPALRDVLLIGDEDGPRDVHEDPAEHDARGVQCLRAYVSVHEGGLLVPGRTMTPSCEQIDADADREALVDHLAVVHPRALE